MYVTECAQWCWVTNVGAFNKEQSKKIPEKEKWRSEATKVDLKKNVLMSLFSDYAEIYTSSSSPGRSRLDKG